MDKGTENKFFQKNLKWVVAIICSCIFIYICTILNKDEIIYLDHIVYNFISKFINNTTTKIFTTITHFGSAPLIIVFFIISIFLIKDKKKNIVFLISILGITAINQALKFYFERPRPDVYVLAQASGYSFPSGHSMCSLAFYGFLIYLLIKSKYDFKVKMIGSILLSVLIFFIGISRIYLGVHYTTDVIAGFSFSIVYLIVITHLEDKYVFNRGNKN